MNRLKIYYYLFLLIEKQIFKNSYYMMTKLITIILNTKYLWYKNKIIIMQYITVCIIYWNIIYLLYYHYKLPLLKILYYLYYINLWDWKHSFPSVNKISITAQ